ncbi:MAG: hypothetical protein L3J28_04940 [Candidatus Polarisedimenticolaceae bacterium]|nr:hypothetical protein [Candidatus Polarisedimenticolaceae bacterium]
MRRYHSITVALIVTSLLLISCGGSGIGGSDQDKDPVVVDHPIAYIKQPIPVDVDYRQQSSFNTGSDLYLRVRASPSAAESNITRQITGGTGSVKDLEVSYDGTRLLFALKLAEIEGAGDDEQPTWNIWEYEIESQSLRRIISTDITAELGQDIAPHYLPDGRIVFSSTRQRRAKAILLDEGKPQFAAMNDSGREAVFVLHVMNSDGNDINQISFNRNHDLDPTVLQNGKIIFSRWNDNLRQNGISLYTIRPDGTELEYLYGSNSHETGSDGSTVQFLQPRELQNGQILSMLKPFNGIIGSGNLIEIDTNNYVDNLSPTWLNRGVLSGSAQRSATVNSARTDTEISPAGRFLDAFPLWDGSGRLLVSWSPCRLIDGDLTLPCTNSLIAKPGVVEAPPLYGIWIYDVSEQTQLPVVMSIEGVMISEVVATQGRDLPTMLVGDGLDATAAESGMGILHIRSVYDIDGVDTTTSGIATLADPLQTTADQRPARFLRIKKAVSVPDDDFLDLAVDLPPRMSEIIGYVPIEPDGSVIAKVPANVALSFEALDQNGRRVGNQHAYWLQFQAGETITCNGCHDPNSDMPHGRSDAVPPSVNFGAVTSGIPFPNTEPAMIAEMGESMAQTRMRLGSAMQPTVGISYEDDWTDPLARAKDTNFSYLYNDLDTTTQPATSDCQATWNILCRTVINYEISIHPLWSKERQLYDSDEVLVADRCTICHDAVNIILDGPDNIEFNLINSPGNIQLDLTDGLSDSERAPDHYKAYEELLSADNLQEEVDLDGNLEDVEVQETDDSGNLLYDLDDDGAPILDQPVMIKVPTKGPSIRAGMASQTFLARFDQGGTHANWLTPAERKLLSEWIEIGAQYYNNPFDAPEN